MTTRTSQDQVARLDLPDGQRIPQLGLGVFKVPPEDTRDVVLRALEIGYRSIDTAAAYQNERGVGEALTQSRLPREEVFITTKVWNDRQGSAKTRDAFERSLDALGLDYVDLYLIHWPVPHQDRYLETWETLCELKADGAARSIGVSNFLPEHLERIIEATGVVPALNQIELHPRLQQRELRAYHAAKGMLTEAWSPLGRGRILQDPTISEIAETHGHTAAQVILRWHIQLGNIVIPKSDTPDRIAENYRLFDFDLAAEEMHAIDSLDRGQRTGPDPATFG